MPESTTPAATFLKLGNTRLLVVKIDDDRDASEWVLDFALRPNIGGGSGDDVCIVQGSSCTGLGPHCSRLSIRPT